MLHSAVPCPPGVRAGRRGTYTPQKSETKSNFHQKAPKKAETTTCVREGNRAVPALRMYKSPLASKTTHLGDIEIKCETEDKACDGCGCNID